MSDQIKAAEPTKEAKETGDAKDSKNNNETDPARTLEKKLKRRPSIKEVMDKNILKKGGKLAGPIAALEKQNLEKKLNDKIARRGSKDDAMKKAGGMEGSNIAPKLQKAAKELEFKLKSDHLNRELANRESKEDAEAKATLFPDTNMAPSLRATARKLKQELTKNKLNQLLENRPTPAQLVSEGVVNPRISSRIKAVAKVLEHNRKTDKVGHLLEDRSDVEELRKRGVLTADSKIAPRLQGVAKQLEFNLAKSNFHYQYSRRKSIDDLIKAGIVRPDNFQEYLKAQDEEKDEDDEEEYGGNDVGYDTKYRDTGSEDPIYHRNSKLFHLTRILLKFVASMAECGEISMRTKGSLKDLIVDQDPRILAVAEGFDNDGAVDYFKASLIRLVS
uniref:Uncharacterized protein n=1 Tax=Lotharella globosa TaxID=91324 RepID=A0A7S3YLT0_9EUKA